MGTILDTLTKDGCHQELLGEAQVREFIAGRIVDWVKNEYPKMEKILPSAWLGEKGAEVIASAVNRVLEQISANPTHELRQKSTTLRTNSSSSSNPIRRFCRKARK